MKKKLILAVIMALPCTLLLGMEPKNPSGFSQLPTDMKIEILKRSVQEAILEAKTLKEASHKIELISMSSTENKKLLQSGLSDDFKKQLLVDLLNRYPRYVLEVKDAQYVLKTFKLLGYDVTNINDLVPFAIKMGVDTKTLSFQASIAAIAINQGHGKYSYLIDPAERLKHVFNNVDYAIANLKLLIKEGLFKPNANGTWLLKEYGIIEK